MSEILIPVLAVTMIGLICGVGLAVASHVMAVKEDERFPAIRECLPGANCGACGFTGCDGYAKALLTPRHETNLCVPGGAEAARKLAAVLGWKQKRWKRRPRLSAAAATATIPPQGRLPRHRLVSGGKAVLRRQRHVHLWLHGSGRLHESLSARRNFPGQGDCLGGCLHLRRLRRLRKRPARSR